MWTEICHLAKFGDAVEQRGRANFELCLLHALGRFSRALEVREAMNWMTSSASFGHKAALVVGKKVFQANDLPLPESLMNPIVHNDIRKQMMFLENLPPQEFYCNSVRILCTDELRTFSPKLDNYFKPNNMSNRFKAWIEDKLTELGARAFYEFAENHFLLHGAVLHQDHDAAEMLLRNGCRINITTSDNLSPLLLACRRADVPLIRLLLSYGADASQNDADNISPLHWIVLLPNSEILDIANSLVNHGANVHTIMNERAPLFFDSLGLKLRATPLWWACACRNHTAVATLLALGADPFHDIDQKKTLGCLKISLETVCSDIVALLLPQIDKLHKVTEEEKQQFYVGIGAGSDSNDFQRWCMHGHAYRKAYTDIMDTLTQHKIPFCPQSRLGHEVTYTPLTRAAMSLNSTYISELLKRGADVNDRDNDTRSTPLSVALASASLLISSTIKALQAIEILIRNGASLKAVSNTRTDYHMEPGCALRYACQLPAPANIIQLIASSAPIYINERSLLGETPFHVLVSQIDDDDIEAVHVLLDLGADPNIETEHEQSMKCCLTVTAMAFHGHCWTVPKLLLDRNASTETGIRGGHRQTLAHYLIHWAFQCPSEERMIISDLECLLDHPVSEQRNLLDDLDHMGISPVALATLYGLPNIVKIFLERGAGRNLSEGKAFGVFQKQASSESILFQYPTLLDLTKSVPGRPPKFVVNDDSFVEGPLAPFGSSVRQCSLSSYIDKIDEIQSLLYDPSLLDLPPPTAAMRYVDENPGLILSEVPDYDLETEDLEPVICSVSTKDMTTPPRGWSPDFFDEIVEQEAKFLDWITENKDRIWGPNDTNAAK